MFSNRMSIGEMHVHGVILVPKVPTNTYPIANCFRIMDTLKPLHD
jgi:hypothetical protein